MQSENILEGAWPLSEERGSALVLLVDDSPTQVRSLALAFERSAFRVVMARDGREALDQARRLRPDVVVSDILMPVMDGFTLCRELRRDPTLNGIPVILLSKTYVDPKDREFALAIGATRFLETSTRPAEIVGAVRDLLERPDDADGGQATVEDEAAFHADYNQRLAAKLVQKVDELEEANRQLDRLYQETLTARDDLALMLETIQVAVSSLDLDTVANRLTEHLVTALRLSSCRICLIDPVDGRLFAGAAQSSDPAEGSRPSYGIELAAAPVHAAALAGDVPLEIDLEAPDCPMSEAERRWAVTCLEPARRAVLAPMRVGDRPVGLLSLGLGPDDGSGRPRERRLRLAGAIASEIGTAVGLAQMHSAQLRAEREERMLAEVTNLVASAPDLDEMLQRVAGKAGESLGVGCAILVRNPDGTVVVPVVYRQDGSPVERAAVQLLGSLTVAPGSPWLHLAEIREPLAFPESLADSESAVAAAGRDAWEHLGLESALLVPLEGITGTVGALLLFGSPSAHIGKAQLPFARRFAKQVAKAVEETRLQQQLMEARAAAEAARAADKLKDHFLGMVSHDLRSPLSSILGFTELLQTREYGPDDTHLFLETIHNEAMRLSRLINDLLDLQRAESGRLEFHLQAVDVGLLAREACQSMAGMTKQHVLSVSAAPDLPAAHGDPDRIRQVLVNLLSNAIKYAPDGGDVTVMIETDGPHLRVAVRDQGLGIPAGAHEYIFSKFSRLEAPAREIRGTGLGLAISKELVERQGGRIWLESEVGKGSTFYFTLPTTGENPLTD